ncbi:MAG: hypothetical protein AB7P07_10770 [Hyphomonadaceae bacterium]
MRSRFLAALSAFAFVCISAASAQPITPPPAAEVAPDTPASTLLPALIAHSRHLATLQDGRLSGEGADFLRAMIGESHFLLIGEDHGNAGVADFATALWREAHAQGYQYGAIEVDPYIAEAANRELAEGGAEAWAAYLARRNSAGGAPFLNWDAETRYAEQIVRDSDGRAPALWGLDQVFIGAGSVRLREIAENARNAEARALAAALANQANAGALDAFARLDGAQLQRLRSLLGDRRDARYATMTDQMIVSHRIYQPFVTGGGEANLANAEREHLMKNLFLEAYAAAEEADRAPPRVVFKFGANHMYRGATPTWVQGLGGFVTEFAAARGQRAAALAVMCGPGGAVASLGGPPTPCAEPMAATYPFLTEHIDPQQVTIFDLRVWRLRPRRWAHLPAEMQQLLGSFDALVFVPDGAAAEFLPGLSLPTPPQ